MNVVVIDRDREVRESIQEFFSDTSQLTLVGAFESIQELPSRTLWDRVHVLLIDPQQFEDQNRKLIHTTGKGNGKLCMLAITSPSNVYAMQQMLAIGATGCLAKPLSKEKLIHGILFAIGGGISISKELLPFNSLAGKSRIGHVSAEALSERERQILKFLAEGKAYKEIAGCANISISTVRQHLHHIYQKLKVTNKGEAIRIAYTDPTHWEMRRKSFEKDGN